METQPTKENKIVNVFKNEVLVGERNAFIFRLIFIAAGYAGITFWLNSIRATASIWFVWFLIIIQLILYFSIFVSCYQRSKIFGLNRTLGFIIFLILAVLGRINNWELIIIPLLVIIMIIISLINKNISEEGRKLLQQK